MKQQIRTLVLTILFSMAALLAAAQTTTHVVQRGETIESIAEKYGITTAALLEANPNAADFFFVGMKLQIPAAEAATATQTTTTSTVNAQQSTPPTFSSSENTNGTSFKNNRDCFVTVGLAYYAGSFKDAKTSGHYGVALDVFNICESLFGASLTISSFNYGLVDKKDATNDMILFGPNISYEIAKNVILALPIQCMCAVSFPSGTTKTHTDWGWVGSPRVYFRFGKCYPNAGLFVNGGFKGEKIECGFMAGLSFSF